MAKTDENLRAWWAVKCMSEAIGADLSKELRCGSMGLAEISEIVLKCEACPQAEACKNMLRAGQGVSEAIKAQCPNRASFEAHAERKDLAAQ